MNVFTGFGGQLIAIILGILVPRFIITGYGSDANGLIGTIGQIFTYMALLEAGIGQAARNALFGHFKDKNIDGISEVTSTAQAYFRKFTIIYAVGVLIISFLLPLVIKTNIDPLTTGLIVFFEGFAGVITFYFVETPSIILSVDGKSYISNGINLVTKVAGYLAKIVIAALGLNIVLMQFAFFLVSVLKVFFYRSYFTKRYSWIKNIETNNNSLKDRNAYVINEVAWTIFSSTDMIVISVFISTELSSVYSIYNMIFSNISLLLNAVYLSVAYMLGFAYSDGIKKYEKVHDCFTSFFLGCMTILMSVTYLLTIPFVSLYTNGVSDVEYVYPVLPIMFCLIQLLSWSRYVSGNLTGLAGYAKKTSIISIVEAVLNVTFSVFLVHRYSIIGVTLATVIALPVKVIWCTYVADKKVMKRSYSKSLSIMGVNFLFFFGVVGFSELYQPSINSYGQFFLWGMALSIVFGIIGIGLNVLVNRDCWQIVRRYILKR